MFDSKLLLVAGAELAVLMLLSGAALLFYVRRLRRLIMALEGKVVDLRHTVKTVRGEAAQARRELAEMQADPGSNYERCLDAAILATRDHYRTLDPDRDIGAGIGPGELPERRLVSLRYAFLCAERDAWSVARAALDWSVFEAGLGHALRLYDPAGLALVDAQAEPAPDTASETGPTRYQDVVQRWRAAAEQARDDHRQLLEMGRDLGAGAEFEALLARCADTWDQFGAGLVASDGGRDAVANEPGGRQVVIANQEEVLRLRNMAVDQHRMIVQLRQRLDEAQSVEEKEQLIAGLRGELERHQRFLQEYEQCSRQLEDELERLLAENRQLRQDALHSQTAPANAQEIERLTQLVDDFTRQSCDMLSAVETLEKENARLREQVGGEPSGVDAMP